MSEIRKVYLNPVVFSRMPNLRLLKFYTGSKMKVNYFIIKSGPNYLKCFPNKLSLLHWEEYPFKSLPLNLSVENLVHFTMPRSKVEELWNGFKVCFT